MTKKSILVKVLKIVALLFAMGLTIYGSIFISVNLSTTIPFDSVVQLEKARLTQRLFFGSCMVMGKVLMWLVIIDSVLKSKQIDIYKNNIYAIIITSISSILLIGFSVVTIITKQAAAMILLTIVPAIFVLCYGIYLLKKRNKNIPNAEELEGIEETE